MPPVPAAAPSLLEGGFPHSNTLAALELRGVRLEASPGESGDAHADRIDTELMSLFRDTRSDAAFEALYLRTRGGLFQWLRWLVRSKRIRTNVLELVQDVYVSIYRYAHTFDARRGHGFRGWARTIAANALRRSSAAAGARGGLNGPHEAQGLCGGDPTDPSPGPQERLLAGEERAELARAWVLFLGHYGLAFSQLAPRDRLALELVEVHGLGYAAVEKRLGVSPSNTKMIMLRARRRILLRMQRSMGMDPRAADLQGPGRARDARLGAARSGPGAWREAPARAVG